MNHWLEAVISILVLFGLTSIAGCIGLPLLNKLQVGQTVREDGPKSHFKKSGTPTFGGCFFLLPLTAVALVLWITQRSSSVFLVLTILMLLFAFAGFLDDWIKVRISKKGLSFWHKTIILTMISILFTVYYLYFAPTEPFKIGRAHV